MIGRLREQSRVREALEHYPVVVLLGPRQCGKSTLARAICEQASGAFFDLEDPACPLKTESARYILDSARGLVVLDEIQHQPELFPLLRVLADRPGTPCRFLLLGSASPQVVGHASESLAGRAAMLSLGGFDLSEAGPDNFRSLWVRGGFPRSWLAATDPLSMDWRTNFVRTFLERDIPALGIRVPAATLRRFWTMVAHFHGQIWNAAEFARSMGTQEATAKHYLDILSSTYVLRVLPPWHENLGKRLVKSPRVYFRDSGLLHFFFQTSTELDILSHPRAGASWEGFAIEQILSLLGEQENAWFYRTQAGAELDLMVMLGGKRYGFEFMLSDHPATTRSMTVAMQDLDLERLFLVHPGSGRVALREKVERVGIQSLPQALGEIGAH
ncbi:MAG: ATP-binding protein [Fibrobacteres bacterium]|nr:ATP-binding protein [Fibrobacterota bacterium]